MQNIAEVLTTATHVDRVAATALRGSQPVSYGDLMQATEGLAAELMRSGVCPGARVLLSLNSTPAAWSSILAVWRLGAVPVPLDDLDVISLKDVITRCNPTAHLVEPERLPVVQQAYSSLGRVIPVLLPPCPNVCKAERGAVRVCGLHPWGPDDEALIGFSSGTTGRPKGIVHSFVSLMAGLENSTASLGLMPDDTVLSVNSFFQIWNIVGILLSGLRSGVTTMLAEPDAAEIVTLIEENRVKVLHCPAAFLIDLANEPLQGRDLGCLQRIITGGAPINSVVALKLRSVLPNCQIRNGYGASEYIHATRDRVDSSETPIGSCGAPIEGVEVLIRDADEKGHGQISVKATSMMKGYLDDPVQTAWSFADGYFLTGDYGCFEDGRLQVLGRMRDTVEVDGRKLLPSQIDEVVIAASGVRDVAAHPGNNGAAQLSVDVVPACGSEVLLECVKVDLFDAFGITPDSIEINVVEQIKRNSNGKAIR